MWKFFRRNRDLATLILILAASLISLWISGKTALAGPKEIGMFFTTAFQQATTSVGSFFSNTFASIGRLVELQQKYDELIKRVQTYDAQQTSLDQLRAENESLRQALKFTTSLNFANLAAQVIGKNPGVLFSTITINKGFNDGITKGMVVIGYQDGIRGLIGRIESVASSSSQIRPLTSEELFVGARLENSRYDGLIHGQGNAGQNLIMQYVDSQAENQIAIGEPVITTGLNSDFPAGIRIGIVAGIGGKVFDNSLELDVKPAVVFSKLEYVYVLIKKSGDQP